MEDGRGSTLRARALLAATVTAALLLQPGAGRGEESDRDRAHIYPIAVIVHPRNKLESLSRAELRAIFLRHRNAWAATSDPILMFNWPPRHPVRLRFDQTILRLSPDEVAAYWIDRLVRGQGMPPRSTASAVLLVAAVARNREAIAYLPYSFVTRQVKVLRIDGVPPDHPSYPLREARRSR